MGGRIEKIIPFTLPDSDIERSLVVIRENREYAKTIPKESRYTGKRTRSNSLFMIQKQAPWRFPYMEKSSWRLFN